MNKNIKIKKIYSFAFLMLIGYLFNGCGIEKKTALKEYTQPIEISVNGNRFVDNFGRQVILNGINVVSKSKAEGYIFKGGPEFYSNLKKWGFNCIRFIIIWDGLEPEPGVYNEQYLKEIDQRIKWAGDNGIYVVLDMHQDLYSEKYNGDGAPAWACLDEGKPNTVEGGGTWGDAYFSSPAIQTSFDNFWKNKKAPDSIGVQDHYANLWKHIAKRYSGNPTVIGYDIMNEPFPGSPALQFMPGLLAAYGKLVYSLSGKILTSEEIMNIWGDAQKRNEAYQLLSTKATYAAFIDTLRELNSRFETTDLQSMYQKVGNAIRQVDTNHILFLEHSIFSNMGIRSSIQRVHLANGNPDALVAYAAHAYDLVTDTKEAASSSPERINLIYNRIAEKGKQLNLPVWLGEWGAYYSNSNMVPVAQHAISLIEKYNFSNAYWSYDPGTENQPYFKDALLRPYPAYINGELINYKYDYNASQLKVEWNENSNDESPTVIYIPWLSRLKTGELDKDKNIQIEKIKASDAGWVIIKPTGTGGKRTCSFDFKSLN